MGGFGGVANSLRGAANTIDQQYKAIDESKTLTPEAKERMKKYLEYVQTGGDLGLEVVKDPETGEYKVQESAVKGQGGQSIEIPTGKTEGNAFTGADGNSYVVKSGKAELVDPKTITFEQLKLANDPAMEEKVKQQLPAQSGTFDDQWAGFDANRGKLIRITVGGQDILATPTANSHSAGGSTIQYSLPDGRTLQIRKANSGASAFKFSGASTYMPAGVTPATKKSTGNTSTRKQ
jgi:hypothetical protein